MHPAMNGYILFPLLFLLTVGFCAGLDLQQAKADLAHGGRKVCPYCHFCLYKGRCPCTNNAWCELCDYKYHCDTTCKELCEKTDPCLTTPSSVDYTCVERTPGKADYVCKAGHVCDEDSKCVDKGKTGQCDFYRCFDERKNCGENGYPLNYGYKYCTRFDQFKDKFTADGQVMVDCVRKCLTKVLLGHYHSNDQAGSTEVCEQIENTAFNSHVRCYFYCDFCHVWSHNKAALNTVYEYKDFFSSQAIKQVASVAAKCTNTTYQDIKIWISDTFTSFPTYSVED